MKHKKKISVVYIITKLELGGAQKVCLSLLKELAAAGDETHLICGQGGILDDHIREEKTIFLPAFKREISFATLFFELKSFWRLVKELRKLKKENPHIIVHTHSTKAGIVGRWAAWFAGIKTRIHTVHGYAFHNHQRRVVWFFVYLCELITSFITTHFICVSSADVKTSVRLIPRFTQKHSIIRAAVDPNEFKLAQKTSHAAHDQTPFIFGTISCFKPQKNLFDLLQAFELVYVRNNACRLEIIGDGIQRNALEKWIQDHDLKTVITLHGWQQNVVPIMAQWHAFSLSSLWEGLPCAIVEARLLKLPVIAYDTGGIHDVIIHGENGLLCTPGKWQTLASHMRMIVDDKNLYEKLSYCKEDLNDFTRNRMIEQHRELYQELN